MAGAPKRITAVWQTVAGATCIALICGAAILWPVYQRKVAERKLAGAAVEMRVHAEQGEAKAQYALGSSSFYGRGVPKDDAAAALWYRKAAEQGYAKA